MADIDVSADPIVLTLTQYGNLSLWPARERTPALDVTFDCHVNDRFGIADRGVVPLTVSVLGSWLYQTMEADPIVITMTQHGGVGLQYGASSVFESVVVEADPIVITISI